MKYLIYILIGFIAFLLGRALAVRRHATKDEMKKLQKKSKEALSKRTEAREKLILAYAKHKGKITNNEVERMFCVSNSTAENYLDKIEKAGKLKQIGEHGRGVHYIISE